MAWLADTCLISEPMKAKPVRSVLAWLEAVDERELFISTLTLGEIDKGVAKLPASKKRAALERWAADDLPARFGRRILGVDAAVALLWGRISGDAERAGAPLPVIDALLAATAMHNGLAVVTRNVRHIARAGARVLNPWEP